ncbi:hypothetical protein CSOJ01_01761 [Colletotrichum sojae]|uniref:Heterokaryon incompatibility domain-containing protein n=1 Tax=Colletotrichum sojae TaxID=2175907 RepID=A0A8H6N3Y1_9PEZI|nr:hypothetical protein CSOJ01_01761 [Colletotrichum sojae]
MRLINVDTLALDEFFDHNRPRYAILSHTWGPNEITFKDFQGSRSSRYRGGFNKIDGMRRVAREQGYEWIWIDTCCIDKSSSTELSEAINSMFSWYEQASVCYIYLEDVPPGDDIAARKSRFRRSRWFTRGWTLQELVAPRFVEFYNSSWECIQTLPASQQLAHGSSSGSGRRRLEYRPSSRLSFAELVADITRINRKVVRKDTDFADDITVYSVAEKMSWASGRETTRKEDRAYSLLGLFGVNMPMLYGEGNKAFERLQEEILKISDDQSIFAWGYGLPPLPRGGLFAQSPDDFAGCRGITVREEAESPHYTLTNKGLHLGARVTNEQPDCRLPFYAAINCQEEFSSTTGSFQDSKDTLAIPLCRLGNRTVRPPFTAPVSLPLVSFGESWPQFYISNCEIPRRFDLFYDSISISFDMEIVDRSVVTTVETYPLSVIHHSAHDRVLLVFNRWETSGEASTTLLVRFRLSGELPDIALRLGVAAATEETDHFCIERHEVATIEKEKSLSEQMFLLKETLWEEETEWDSARLKPVVRRREAQRFKSRRVDLFLEVRPFG